MSAGLFRRMFPVASSQIGQLYSVIHVYLNGRRYRAVRTGNGYYDIEVTEV